MNQNPLEKSKPKLEKGMNEKETKEFLIRNGAVPLSFLKEEDGQEKKESEKWNPGEPIIFVFHQSAIEQMIENEEQKLTRGVPKSTIPSLARIEKPTKINLFPRPAKDGEPKNLLAIENTGEQVDYYVIDSKTEEIRWIRSSASFRGPLDPYIGEEGNVFRSLDRLFPKKEKPTRESIPPLESKNLNEDEVYEFLKRHDVKKISSGIFNPHQPLLYVFEETDKDDKGPFGKLPKERRPSICLVHNPISLRQPKFPFESNGGEHVSLLDSYGLVDYFYISRAGEVVNVRTSNNTEISTYRVRERSLYMPNDNLFRPSNA